MASARKTLLVALSSTFLTLVVVSNAFYQKKQFYPSVVYLVRSSPSMGVLYIQGFVMVWVFSQILRKLLFGTLQAAEVEHMVEEFWYAVPETCLLFAAFREDFSPFFVGKLTLLFFFKAFHWLADVRIDFMERTPLITRTFHARAASMICLLVFCDAFLMGQSLAHMWATGPSVQMVFALEYAILLLLALDITAKYILNSIDLQSENPWENKTVYMAYVEVVLGFLKVSCYFAFMVFMAKVHIFPLYITRRVFIATKKFKKSIQDVIMSRRAIYNLNNVYPDVTPEELQGVDNICIICREEMVNQCKRLPCGHIFHTACLRSWFQRQQLCPTCRSSLPSEATEQQMTRQRPQQQNMDPARPQQQGQDGPLPQQHPGWVPPQPQAPPDLAEEQGAEGQPQTEEGGEPVQSQEAGADNARPKQATDPRTNNGQPSSFEEWLAAVGGTGPFPAPPTVPQGTLPSTPLLPPLPPHVMPYGSTSTNLQSLRLNCLSDEELQALEGTERENVESRIGVLKNIQLLLDCAVSQMNQYYTVTGQLPFQDSILLTDVGRSSKKQTSSSGASLSSSTPREAKKRTKETRGWEGSGTVLGEGRPPLDRSQSWVPPSTSSSPSVFQSLLESKTEEEVQSPLPETGPLEPPHPQPPYRSFSSPATSDSELRQRRLDKLANLKHFDSNSSTQEKDNAPLLPSAADSAERREAAEETDEKP